MNNNVPPKYLQWENMIYKYISNKQGILLYGHEDNDPYDEYSSSSILIIEHRKDKPINDAFYVLFCEGTTSNSSRIRNFNLSNFNRMAKPYECKH